MVVDPGPGGDSLGGVADYLAVFIDRLVGAEVSESYFVVGTDRFGSDDIGESITGCERLEGDGYIIELGVEDYMGVGRGHDSELRKISGEICVWVFDYCQGGIEQNYRACCTWCRSGWEVVFLPVSSACDSAQARRGTSVHLVLSLIHI